MNLPAEPSAPSTKERRPPLVTPKESSIEVVPSTPEIPREVEAMEAVSDEVSLPGPVIDDSGQVLVDLPSPQKVTITLPLTEEEIGQALRQKISESIRWLAEWVKMLAQKAKGKFIYKTKD